MAGLALALTATTLAHAVGTAQTSARERGMYVSVLDGEGAAVTGLGPADFVVREDGAQREVVRAEPAAAPMQIAILIDTSEATNNAMQDIRPAVRSFVERMHERNEIALITFGDRPTILVESTHDLDRLTKGLDRTFSRPGTGSYLLDALYDTTQGFRRREADRPVILAITAEGLEFSNRGRDRVLESLHASGAALHAIVLGAGGGASTGRAERDRSIVLSDGTDATGGRRDNLRSGSAVRGRLEQAASELSGQYLVEYVRPETLVPPETIEVAAKDPALMARGNPVLTTQMP